MLNGISIENILLIVSVLLLLGVLASKASARLFVPALALFLAIGMLAGSEGLGGIPYDDPVSAQFLGVLALVFILFAGGLETDRDTFSRVLWQGLSLATLGVLLTALLVGWCARYVLDIPWLEAVLLGSVVSSTDAAAVFAVLRSQKMGLKGMTKPLLELESGSNDPMAVFLTTAAIGLLTGTGGGWAVLLPRFVLQMAVGGAMGYVAGRGTVLLLNRIRLETEGLYPVLTIGCVLFTYGAAALLWGNGFLAVYFAGIVMGNAEFVHKRLLIRFHDGLAWLMQVTMFLVLGLLVFPSRLVPVAGVSLLLSLFLLLVARPVAVLISLAFARLRFRQKVLIAWVGLRGAVPIVLATFPFVAGLPRAELYFDVVFFIVLTSVLIQGTSIPLMARWLRLDVPLSARHRRPLEFFPTGEIRSDLIELKVHDASPVAGHKIMDLQLPRSALIVLVERGEDFVAPNGSTVLQTGDTLMVLVDKSEIPRLRALIGTTAT